MTPKAIDTIANATGLAGIVLAGVLQACDVSGGITTLVAGPLIIAAFWISSHATTVRFRIESEQRERDMERARIAAGNPKY